LGLLIIKPAEPLLFYSGTHRRGRGHVRVVGRGANGREYKPEDYLTAPLFDRNLQGSGV